MPGVHIDEPTPGIMADGRGPHRTENPDCGDSGQIDRDGASVPHRTPALITGCSCVGSCVRGGIVILRIVISTGLPCHLSRGDSQVRSPIRLGRAGGSSRGDQQARSGIRDRDLYVFVVGPDGTVVGHGYDPARLGLEVRTVKDSSGDPYGRRILDEATDDGVWIDYLRTDPENR